MQICASFARSLPVCKNWPAFRSLFGMQLVIPYTVLSLLETWKFGFVAFRGPIPWGCTLPVIIWWIWLERSKLIFNNKSNSVDTAAMKVWANVISWTTVTNEFIRIIVLICGGSRWNGVGVVKVYINVFDLHLSFLAKYY